MRVMLSNADAIFQICPDLASLDDKYEHQAWSAAPGKGNRLMSLMPWGKLRGTEDTDEALSLSTTFLLMLLLPLSIPMFSPSLLFTFLCLDIIICEKDAIRDFRRGFWLVLSFTSLPFPPLHYFCL